MHELRLDLWGRGLVAALVLALPATAWADAAADRCGASKLKAAGRHAQALVSCAAKATRAGLAVDPACETTAGQKMATSFAKAESGGDCATTADAAAASAESDAAVDAWVAALLPAATDEERLCASSKMKALGKNVRGVVGCYASGASRSEGPAADCLQKADDKLALAWAKAEDRGGCATTGDQAARESDVDALAGDQVAALSPVCGDGIAGPTQACEPGDDGACPGYCVAACECVTPPECGDGVAELPEECDDGAQSDGDGCSAACLLEDASALCTGVAAAAGTAIDAVPVADGFDQPMHVAAPPLDPTRLFVVERSGVIRIVRLADSSVDAMPFLDISDLVGTGGEGGLLSMAFHPDYESNRRFFVNYTDTSGDTVIARYEADAGDPDVADESTARTLLVVGQPYSNHNGGQVAFGPDGYLYVGMGDGGSGGDPSDFAQSDATLLGKMLRLDVDVEVAPYRAVPLDNPFYVDGSSDLELIWSKGLRNPWRFSFDRGTGDLLMADVGQGFLEEIDWQSAASGGGENWGWDTFEGTDCFEPAPLPSCPMPATGFSFPIHEYDHSDGCSVTGGFVYRGCALPDLHGQYFFSDWCSSFLRTLELSGGMVLGTADRTADAESAGASFASVVSFGEDARGELYVVMQGGEVWRIEAQ